MFAQLLTYLVPFIYKSPGKEDLYMNGTKPKRTDVLRISLMKKLVGMMQHLILHLFSKN